MAAERMLLMTALLTLLGGICVFPAAASAQATSDRLVLLTLYEVELDLEASFREYLRDRVRAAREAGLTREEGWVALRADNRWLVVQHVPSFAVLAEPDPLRVRVRGTPGEATLRAAQASLAGVDFITETRLLSGPAAWRHEPADAAAANYAFVQEFRVRHGSEAAFDARRADFVSFLGEIGLPYRYEAYRPLLGVEVAVGIVWPDDLARYYSEFSPAVFSHRYPDRFPPLARRLRDHLKEMRTTLFAVQHDCSYPSR